MINLKRGIILLVASSITVSCTGCWNYREVDKMGIVAGVAVDKGTSHKYKLTIELVEISQGRDAKPRSKIVTSEGDSMFDAVRNEISVMGKNLYWSHAKVIIISKELASEGIIKTIDWYARDTETRDDVDVLVSGGSTAGEILKGHEGSDQIKSFELDDILTNEKLLSKAPLIEVWHFINDLEGEGISPVIPQVVLRDENDKKSPQIIGCAVFNRDEILGFINAEEAQNLLFIRNKVKSGVLAPYEKGKKSEVALSLKIFKSTTKVKPAVRNNRIEMDIKVETEVAIDEIDGPDNYVEDDARIKLEHDTEQMLKSRLERHIEKIKSDFGSDIFGFGAKVRETNPKLWKKIGTNWKQIFKDLPIAINVKIHIRNSAMMSRTIKVGE